MRNLTVKLATVREEDEIKQDNDARKELTLERDSKNYHKIEQLKTFIVRYARTVYQPIIDCRNIPKF
ncbi:MAG: hypothetical protein GF383_09915 [Candidatus Lokiarchaeota archaeon]|nr:hypothetical protein [Candidatus Lokiarchaeota archaeon]